MNFSEIKNKLIKQIQLIYKSDRKPKYSIKHKLNVIINVLTTGIPWSSINNKANESTYRKFYYQLIKQNIFKNLFNKLVNSLANKQFTNVYIDTTTILNKQCKLNNVNYCSKDRKHKGIKISTIVDDEYIPLGITIDKGNVHDIKMVDKTIPNNLNIKYLIGDKGYISKPLKQRLFINKKIKLIYPYRNYNKSKAISKDGSKKFKKNQIYSSNTLFEKQKLKKRHKIENCFSNLKQFRRLSYIYEKDIKNFKGFVFLGFLLILNYKIIKKKYILP